MTNNNFLTTRDEIDSWCLNQFHPEDYRINDDLTVDVFVDVYLTQSTFLNGDLPIKFGKCAGSFDVSDSFVSSCQGFPNSVRGTLNISDTNITSFQGITQEIGQSFHCRRISYTTTQYFPKKIAALYFKKPNTCSHYDLRYILLSEIMHMDRSKLAFAHILFDGRIDGIMPSGLIPEKIRQLKILDDRR